MALIFSLKIPPEAPESNYVVPGLSLPGTTFFYELIGVPESWDFLGTAYVLRPYSSGPGDNFIIAQFELRGYGLTQVPVIHQAGDLVLLRLLSYVSGFTLNIYDGPPSPAVPTANFATIDTSGYSQLAGGYASVSNGVYSSQFDLTQARDDNPPVGYYFCDVSGAPPGSFPAIYAGGDYQNAFQADSSGELSLVVGQAESGFVRAQLPGNVPTLDLTLTQAEPD